MMCPTPREKSRNFLEIPGSKRISQEALFGNRHTLANSHKLATGTISQRALFGNRHDLATEHNSATGSNRHWQQAQFAQQSDLATKHNLATHTIWSPVTMWQQAQFGNSHNSATGTIWQQSTIRHQAQFNNRRNSATTKHAKRTSSWPVHCVICSANVRSSASQRCEKQPKIAIRKGRVDNPIRSL